MSDATFQEAVVALGTLRDGDIFVTRVANSGTRFQGFRTIDHTHVAKILAVYAQEATYSVENGSLIITCRPFQTSTQDDGVVGVSEIAAQCGLEAARDTLHAGAVSSHLFRIPKEGVSSKTLSSISAHPRTVKVFVEATGINVLNAHDRNIEQGLVATLQSQRAASSSQACFQSLHRRPALASRSTTRQLPTQRAGKSFLRKSLFSSRRRHMQGLKSF